jgi:hypothetical protein
MNTKCERNTGVLNLKIRDPRGLTDVIYLVSIILHVHMLRLVSIDFLFFFFGATAPSWALAYLREILRFTSVF